MSRLKAEGTVVRVAGKGTIKPSLESPKSTEIPVLGNRTAAEDLAEQLVESIRRGELRRGDRLPQSKFLRLEYRLSDRTIRRAYTRLVRLGLVTRIGSAYHVGKFRPKTGNRGFGTVLLIAESPGMLPKIFTSYERSSAYYRLERELHANGLQLRYLSRGDVPRVHNEFRKMGKKPDGILFFRLNGNELDIVPDVVRPFMCRGGTPDFPLLIDLQSYGNTTRRPYKLNIFSQGNLYTEQARTVARYCRRDASRPIIVFFNAERIRKNPRGAYLRRFKLIHEVISSGDPHADVSLAVLSPETSSLTSDTLYEEIAANNRSYIDYLNEKYGYSNGVSMSRLHENLRIVPDFNAVLEHPNQKSIWLCSSDELTEKAIYTCVSRRLKVPHDISILSLENAPSYYHLSVSACAPDWDLVGYTMAHAIIRDLPMNKTSKGFLRIPCSIIHRGTTFH